MTETENKTDAERQSSQKNSHSPVHADKKDKNRVMLALIFAFVAIVFAITVFKIMGLN